MLEADRKRNLLDDRMLVVFPSSMTTKKHSAAQERGFARARALTPRQRSMIARKAAKARWSTRRARRVA